MSSPSRDSPPGPASTYLLPACFFVTLASVTLIGWYHQRQQERREIRRTTELVRSQLASRIDRTFRDTLRPIMRMRNDYYEGRWSSKAQFIDTTVPIMKVVPSFRYLAWVGADGVCRATWARSPRIEQNLSIEGQTVTQDSRWSEPIARARAARAATIGGACQAEPSILRFVLPLFDPRRPDGDYDGALIGGFSVLDVLTDLLDSRIDREFSICLHDRAGNLVLRQGGQPSESCARLVGPVDAEWMLDGQLVLHIQPTAALWDAALGAQPAWILIVGGLLSLLAPGALLQAMVYRRRDRLRNRQHLEAIESLNQVSASLTASPGDGMLVLEQLAAEARNLLHMPVVSILLLEPDQRSMRVVYTRGTASAPLDQVYSLDELSASRQAMRTGQIVTCSDMAKDPGVANPHLGRRYGVVALLVIPLLVNGRALGTMVLSDRLPRQFTEHELHMARLWGAQAAVILAHSQMYSELRNQAETNRTLLRELNHRVKNNLAGIAALLSIDTPPDLSDTARAWLDRVTARIETMARAHDLFSGGVQRVELGELLRRTMDGVQALRPPGTRFHIELPDTVANAPLPTHRAVTLAMILHELCCNAMEHGLAGARGTVHVRGRCVGPSRLAIDVIDALDTPHSRNYHQHGNGNDNGWPQGLMPTDPSATSDAAAEVHADRPATDYSAGVGLKLVAGLVGRELRGRLTIRPTPQGGTIATVEFPLPDGSLPQTLPTLPLPHKHAIDARASIAVTNTNSN
ncbi:sensor histidine kinase [Fontivita pretiosa]|uniref:sensor histidine kinase n=1 Tax=Fontivita pretiosa TaxID=2989684 RepID=UPI003D164095